MRTHGDPGNPGNPGDPGSRTTTPGDTLRRRLAAQALGPDPAPTVADAVRRAGAIQAQAVAPARLAVRVRTAGLAAADVDAACARPDVVRSWLMRGTLHMVPAEDLRWMLDLFGPVILTKTQRRRDQLGLTADLCERALQAAADALAGGRALTRAQLMIELAGRGIPLGAKTQQPAHFLVYAAAHGLICRGPDSAADEPTYVLLDDWLPAAPRRSQDEALAELACRHLAAYGPADAADFAAWSGLPAALTKPAHLEARAAAPAPAAPPGHPRSRVHLLGAFDAYLLGHKSRDQILDPTHSKRVNAGGGMISPVVLLDGRVAGTWSLDRSRKVARFAVDWFEPLPEAAEPDFEAELADVARFLGIPEYAHLRA